jgi:outer membrane protein OmpA-like peptidoglycan-associated protein
LLCCAAASADLHFGADPASAAWQFSGNRTACRLTHEIPSFGSAVFSQEAGGRLAFELTSWRVDLHGDYAVTTETPDWSAVHADPESLGEAKGMPPHGIVAGTAVADSMLRALYLGRFSKVASDELAVSISAVGFRAPYEAYSRCVADLLPASFRQLKHSSIAFASGRADLDDAAKARLQQIAQYLQADRSVVQIRIDGYTDSTGREPKNRALSEARARAVTDFLVASGFDAEAIETRFHSSRFPAAANNTDEGRAQNRRVVVQLVQRNAKVAQR